MLDRLNDVQQFDLQIDSLQEEKGQTPPELIDTQRRMTSLEERLRLRQEERGQLRRRVSENEAELQALEGRRKSAAESSLRADSAKEASQYQNQELQFATRVQELEEDTMPLMEDLERLDNDIALLEREIEELSPVLGDLTAQEERRLAAIEERIAGLERERAALADGIDRQLLRQYEQVRRSRRGLGLAEVVQNSRCGGCNVRLPIHVVQKARKAGSVTRCPSCGRILWSKD